MLEAGGHSVDGKKGFEVSGMSWKTNKYRQEQFPLETVL